MISIIIIVSILASLLVIAMTIFFSSFSEKKKSDYQPPVYLLYDNEENPSGAVYASPDPDVKDITGGFGGLGWVL